MHQLIFIKREYSVSCLITIVISYFLILIQTVCGERERESSIETYEATLSWDPALEKGAMDLLSACH